MLKSKMVDISKNSNSMSLNPKLLTSFLLFIVKKQYYRLALVHHPDRVEEGKKNDANNNFHTIHQAYSILSDFDKKRAYDDGLDVLFTRAIPAQ